MPTQPRKLYQERWQQYYAQGGRRPKPAIFVDWVGPAMLLAAGTWSVNEEASWEGPAMALDGGSFSASATVDYVGPAFALEAGSWSAIAAVSYEGAALELEGGTFTALESATYSGPDLALDGGSWSAIERASYVGTVLDFAGGSWSVNEEASWEGPAMGLEAGSWSAIERASWTGPDAAYDGGSFSAAEVVLWQGPDMGLDAGSWSALESASYAGPDASLDGGTWSAVERHDYAGPDVELEGGTFTATEIARVWGPELAMYAGDFSATESASWVGPDVALDAGTFTGAETVFWEGPDVSLEAGAWSALESADYAGPDLAMDAGAWSALEVASWSGPEVQLDGGTYTASGEYRWVGPELSLDGGTFTALESAGYAGPDLSLDGGTFTAAVTVGYVGPDLSLDGGTWDVSEGASWAGPDLSLDGGTFSATESAGYAGPDMQLDGGTFTAALAASWVGPDMQLDGGTFTVDEAAGYAGPDMALDAGTFSALESAAYVGPDMALDAGTFTVSTPISVNWTGPDMQLDGGTYSATKMQNIVTDGVINAFAADATGGYIAGGSFTKAYLTEDGRGGGDILAISNATRSLLAHVNGPINAIVSDGAGGVYIGGDFTQVGGVARQRLARILSNGTLSSFDPGCDGVVHTLLYSTLATNGAVLYVGGRFNVCGGLTRYNLAQISTTTGAAVSTWSAHAAVSGSYTQASVFCLSPGRSTANVETGALRFGGYFDTVAVPGSTLTRQSMCQLADGTAPTISGAVNLTKAGGLGTCYALYTYRRSQNNDVYAVIGGDFTAVNGTTRNNVALWNSSTGTLAALYPGNSGANAPVRAITGNHAAGHIIYFGGEFTTFGGLTRNRIAGWNSNNNTSPYTPTTFNPSASSTVRALALDGSFLYAAGDFTTFGGRAAKQLAKINTSSDTTAEDWNTTLAVFSGSVKAVTAGTIFGAANVVAGGDDMTTDFVNRVDLLNVTGDGAFGPIASDVVGTVHALHRHADTIYVGGQFAQVGGVTGYKGLAKLDIVTGVLDTGWKPTSVASLPTFYALAYHNGAIFAGGTEVKKADASTGSVDLGWTPTVSGTVNAFHLHGDKLVIGDDGLRAVNLTTGAAATWADSTPSATRALARVDDTLYAVGVFGIRRYAFDTGVNDTGWTPVALAGSSRAVVANAQHIYVGGNASPFAYKLNADGTDANLVTGFNSDVLALLILSENFVLFGGSMTASTLTTRLVKSMGYALEA